ncbi:iron-containing alcohol dehydrogenase, partial [Yersinia enterocolitica]|nr:iron-containing alcohol dehydrogenase [Yersinia enterocolitica]
MSTNAIRVQVGPANYFSFPGAIDKLSEFYPQAARENALWIYGERALAAAIDYLPAEFNSPQAVCASFSTHCSESTVADLVSAAGSDRQVVIGIGGGAVLDTAKVVARK